MTTLKEWTMEWFARHATALAVGEGYDSSSDEDKQTRNAIAHAKTSATLALIRGQNFAIWAEDVKEKYDNSSPEDEFKDKYNNEVGRKIADWMVNNGYHVLNYSQAELQDIMDDLIVDALDNGHLIIDADPNDGDGIDPRITSQSSPTWTAPTQNWEDAAAARDYDHEIPGTETSDIFLPAGWTEQFDEPSADPLAEETELPPIPGIKPVADVGAWVPGVVDAFDDAKTTASPLVLDLAGTGINLAALNGAGSVYWNITESDFANASGWIAEGTGLLAIDLNENGIIDDHSELFGTLTTDGFTILSGYDTNTDDAITSADDDWDDLLVWTDDNADGYSQASELHTLDDLLITSINLNASQVSYDIAGNPITHESTFTIDGNTHDIVDAWFAYDTVNTAYVGDYELNPYALFLPTLRGYGNLPDLHIAMSLDGDLLNMVEEFALSDLSQSIDAALTFGGDLDDILFKWAGVDQISPTSRGSHLDARQLEFLEAFVDEEWLHFGTHSDPQGEAAADVLTAAWSEARGAIISRLLYQVMNGERLFDDGSAYDPLADAISATSIDFDAVEGFIVENEELSGQIGRARLVLAWTDTIFGLGNLSQQDFDDLEALMPGEFTIDALVNGDTLYGAGDNSYGTSDDDLIVGGPRHDDLYGYDGDDLYFFNLGDSSNAGSASDDSIWESPSEGSDTILFGNGIDPNDVRLWTNYQGNLFIQYSTTDFINVWASQSGGETTIGQRLEQIAFDDGTEWDLTGGLYLKNTHSGGTVYASAYGDTVEGGNGTDYLHGWGGNDILSGGAGYDGVYGGAGNDTFLFSLGDSSNGGENYAESINENLSEGTDTIQFTAGIDPEDVRLWTNYQGHLYIQYSDTDFIIANASTTDSQTRIGEYVESIVFDDETEWDLTAGLHLKNKHSGGTVYGSAYGDTIEGGNGTDYLHGWGGNDILSGGAGYDGVYGGAGNDTFLFSLGDSSNGGESYAESINENLSEGTDTIQFTAGIDPEDVRLWTNYQGHLYIQYSDTDFIVANASTTDSQTRIGEYVESIVFDDETEWDLTAGLYLKNKHSGGTVYASAYGDTVEGGNGADYLYGWGGNDTLIGGADNDGLFGDVGNDVYVYSAGMDQITETSGEDTLRLTGGVTINDITVSDYSSYHTNIVVTSSVNEVFLNSFRQSSGYEIETIEFDDGFEADLSSYNSWQKGTSGNDTLGGDGNANVIIGYDGADDIDAGAGDDHVHGGAGADTINGEGDNDLLHGGVDNDTLDGDAGDDILYGGDGLDTLWGDTGADTFVFTNDSAFNNVDVVKDFDISTYEDVIDIRDILSSNGYEHGVDAITDWIEITTNGSDSDLKIDLTGMATFGGGTQIAKLEGITGLTDEAALVSSGNLLVA